MSRDLEQACARARHALQIGRADDAVAEADIAIGHILQHGLRLDEFIRLALRRAPSEILLRFERQSVARVPRLHLPLALRWKALRRARRVPEAREMRAVCVRLFPERASVWAEAGNQALDERDVDLAETYFARCLRLDPDWTAGLAGQAIVLETRKDWPAALVYRERVVEVEDALAREDPPSLQRVMRYAAALGRVGRWDEAGVLFRRCLMLGAAEHLPAERQVLTRVFSRELYAPALVTMLSRPERLATPAPDEVALAYSADEVAFALHEAAVFAEVYASLCGRTDLADGERLLLLGMCAWLAGDYVRAYALLDEAELDRDDDVQLQYFLLESARAIGAPECANIENFAVRSAQAALERARSGELVREAQLFYALIVLAPRQSEVTARTWPTARALDAEGLQQLFEHPTDAAPDRGCESEVVAQLRHLIALRALLRSRGRSALEAARDSADAVARLARAAATARASHTPTPAAPEPPT